MGRYSAFISHGWNGMKNQRKGRKILKKSALFASIVFLRRWLRMDRERARETESKAEAG
jgi:hypothetical protein